LIEEVERQKEASAKLAAEQEALKVLLKEERGFRSKLEALIVSLDEEKKGGDATLAVSPSTTPSLSIEEPKRDSARVDALLKVEALKRRLRKERRKREALEEELDVQRGKSEMIIKNLKKVTKTLKEEKDAHKTWQREMEARMQKLEAKQQQQQQQRGRGATSPSSPKLKKKSGEKKREKRKEKTTTTPNEKDKKEDAEGKEEDEGEEEIQLAPNNEGEQLNETEEVEGTDEAAVRSKRSGTNALNMMMAEGAKGMQSNIVSPTPNDTSTDTAPPPDNTTPTTTTTTTTTPTTPTTEGEESVGGKKDKEWVKLDLKKSPLQKMTLGVIRRASFSGSMARSTPAIVPERKSVSLEDNKGSPQPPQQPQQQQKEDDNIDKEDVERAKLVDSSSSEGVVTATEKEKKEKSPKKGGKKKKKPHRGGKQEEEAESSESGEVFFGSPEASRKMMMI